MKNFKSIAAAIVLIGVLAVNSFAGILISEFNANETPCGTQQKTGIIPTNNGIIVYLTGIIVYAIEPSQGCSESAGLAGILISE